MTLGGSIGSFAARSTARLTAALQRLRRPPVRAVILLYHRIAALDVDPWGLAVTPEHFAEHLEGLKRIAVPVPINQLDRSLAAAGAKRLVAAVTFDDGYADNLHAAIPCLERFDVPATFFTTAGLIEGGGEFWWDTLARIVFATSGLADAADGLGTDSLIQNVRSVQTDGDRSSPRDRTVRDSSWRAWEAPTTAEQARYLEWYGRLRDAGEDDRARMLEELAGQCGALSPAAPRRQVLDAGELARLARHPLAEIGAHSLTHAALAGLSLPAQRTEIVRGKAVLEQVTGRSVSSFAYPFGHSGDFTAETVALVRSAGYERACTAMAGVVEPDGDAFLLPRLGIPDGDGAAFERMVNGLLARVPQRT